MDANTAQIAKDEPVYTEGACEDGAAILREGKMMTITQILDALNTSEDVLAVLIAIKLHGELACVYAGSPFFGSSGKKPPTKDVWQFPRHMLPEIDAAITKATAS